MTSFLILCLALAATPAQRTFHIQQRYDVPAGAAAQVYLPLPSDDPWQTITNVTLSGADHRIVRDARYGNRAVRFEVPRSGAHLIVGFDVLRRERGVDLRSATGKPAPDRYRRWLKSDRLVQIDGRVRGIAAEVTAGAKTPLEKARAIYAYVLSHMRYEKKGTGWGRGDIIWACDQKYGNCTDFHSLMIGLLRASGIPARFQIGFKVPPEGGTLPGYHCWMDFYLDGVGWVPVDASEAWLHPDKRDYYFGHHDADRFALSLGRDIRFPGMKGEPLNYFVYAYAESDAGKPLDVLPREITAVAKR